MAQEEKKKKEEIGFWMKVGLWFVWLGKMIGKTFWIYLKSFGLAVARGWNRFWKWFWPLMPTGKPKFASLAPTENAQHIQIYSEALSQALLDKNVLNIAVAGTFGSGKSSFLRTYFKDHPSFWPFGGKKNKVITVSLADLVTNEKPREKGNENPITRQEIELSILHQLFFHKRAGSLADSHYTKIQKFGAIKLCAYTIGMLAYILSIVHLVKPRWLTITFELQKLGISEYREWWHWACAIITVLGTAWLLAHLVRVIAQLALRKLTVNSASIEIANKREKSILNEHIDEIIYFFSVTGYNVVILEDLDRFKQQSIFVKLREINYLINNSEEVKQRVRFIYALSDDMFTNEERTKFFDFIIPIIPLVDNSNAGDMLHTLVPKNLGHVVDAVAVYLHDARILSNIVNEFYVYKDQFNGKDNKEDDQIFALIVYKNLYPDDFENLRTLRTGKLAEALQRRDALIKDLTQQIKADIDTEQKEITRCRQEMISDKAELRQLLAAVIMHEAWDKTSNTVIYNCVNINGTTIGVENIAEENNFELLKSANAYTLMNYRSVGSPVRNSVESAMKKAYGELGYEQRLALIEGKASIPEREAHLQELVDKKAQLQKMTIQQLLHVMKKEQEGEDTRTEQERFINDMLYGGYITANYSAYISSIHLGRFSANDYAFIRSVRVEEPLKDQNFDLYNAIGIVEKLELGNFSQIEILNVDLMDALLGTKKYEEKRESVIELLKTYAKECMEFIALYVQIGLYAELLIQKLSADKKKLLGDAIEKSKLPTDSKLNVLKSIFAHANKEDIAENIKIQRESIAKMSDFFLWDIPDERLRFAAKELDVHFEAIDEGVKPEFVEFVRDNNLYAITPEMLRRIIPKEEVDDESFYTQNYTCIATNYPVISQYIEENIKEYVEDVTLAIPTNKQERPEYLAKLLTIEDLSDELREQIIANEEATWQDINEGGEIDSYSIAMLYKYKRIKVTWENVLILYSTYKSIFVDYMKDEEVVDALQEQGQPDFETDNREKWVEMQKAIVADESLVETSKALVDCFDIAFEKAELEHCDHELLELLIDKGKVARGVDEYNLLHSVDRDLSFPFFINYYDNYSMYIPEMTIDEYDFEHVFDAKYGLSVEQKLHILTNVDLGDCISKYSVGNVIDLFMLPEILPGYISEPMKEVVKFVLCYAEADSLAKIRLCLKFPLKTNEEAEQMVRALGSAYTDGHRLHHQIPYSPEAYDYCRMLKKLEYIRNFKWYKKIGKISIGEF